MTSYFSFLIFLFAVTFVPASQAWGPLGHWTISRVTQAGLTPKTQNAVNSILSGQSLAAVSVLPDEWKYQSKWSFTTPYHFDTVADGSTYLKALQGQDDYERQEGGVVPAVLRGIEVLRNYPSTGKTKEVQNAMIFLNHFFADLHQPLHVGKPGDRGGNDIPVNWMGNSTNLHVLWDSDLIRTAHKDIIKSSEVIQNSKTYASYLIQAYTPQFKSTGEDFADLMASQSFNENNIEIWLQDLAKLRGQLYQGYSSNQQSYVKKFQPQVDYQIYIAGTRLASVLNSIFDPQESPQASRFKRSIENIIGKVGNIIHLLPASRSPAGSF